MAVTLNASTSAGFIQTADTSGILQLQTANTTAITIDASQNVTFTNQPTFTGGTANGVLYLNGSKAVTSGSALVFDGANLGIGTSSPLSRLHLSGNDSTPLSIKMTNTTASVTRNIGVNNSGSLVIETAGVATDLTLNSSGNLGLGVTPSAWGASGTLQAIQIKNTSLAGSGANAYWGSNWYGGGFDKYISGGTVSASLLVQTGGQFVFYTAGAPASHSAGDAISFTQAMTLDASGNLALGNTSALLTAASRTSLTVNGTSTAIFPLATGGTAQGFLFTDGTEYRVSAYQNIPLTFHTNNTERARIDSSGNFYLSGNTTMGPLTDNQGTVGDGTHRWRVIYAVNGTIQTSDGTQKTDVQTSDLGLDFINSLNPVSFKWIDSTYGRTHYGFIAQEIEQTLKDKNAGDFGGLVIDDMEDGSKLYGLRHHELIAPLVKALQEQQAIIESLKADVAALKGQA